MFPSALVKLRPITPWRLGPEDGSRDLVSRVLHSDVLYSSLTIAMSRLGRLDEWLAATTGDTPAVRFSSGFPFVDETLFVVPPRNLWPPPPSSRVRWKSASLIPLSLVDTLLASNEARIKEDEGWQVDPDSECLLPPARNGRARGPFRIARRRSVPVDRLSGVAGEIDSTACVEFSEGAGYWLVVVFADSAAEGAWANPVKAALRLLADDGIGGGRARGWGRFSEPEITPGKFPGQLLRAAPRPTAPPESSAEGEEPQAAPEQTPEPAPQLGHWLLSLYTPAASDQVEWTRGAYSVIVRSGRTATSGVAKRALRMIAEGSVLMASSPLTGTTRDVAPEGSAHPILRNGFAVSISIPWRVTV